MERFVDINEYMLLTREARREHLRLDESCIEIGGDSRTCRNLVAHYLHTTVGDYKVYVCHACYNEKCSNPRHLYWGTPADNVLDTKESGRWKPIHARVLDKHGPRESAEMFRRAGRLGGLSGGGHNALSSADLLLWREAIDSVDTMKFGFIGKIAKKMNCSHTHARRVLNNYFPQIESFKRKSSSISKQQGDNNNA